MEPAERGAVGSSGGPAGAEIAVAHRELASLALPVRVRRRLAGFLALLGGVVAVVAGIGVLGRGDGATRTVVSVRGEVYELVTTGVYAHNPDRLVAEGIGWDLVTLVLVVPALLVASPSVARGSVRGRLVALGLLAYLFYQYLMYAMAWAVGPLLPAFIGLYAASLIGAVWLVTTLPPGRLAAHVADGFPRRSLLALSVGLAVLLVGMWVPMLAEVLTGRLADNLLGQTTLVVQALDLGIVVPAAIATAALLWRRHPGGSLLAAVLVVKGLAMATAIVAMVLASWLRADRLDVPGLVIFAGVAVACALLLRSLARTIRETPEG